MAVINETTTDLHSVSDNYKCLDSVVYEKLKERALSVDDITSLLQDKEVTFSKSVGKEVAWRLVEQGKAQFNNEWLLEQS
ncbi:MAG: hypothetical protein KME47_07745 [Nodosilinea sp. WJT8-NPBG4]|nr:hypothetical protein [Nodosilinea sp. WJT8-NPBG4]